MSKPKSPFGALDAVGAIQNLRAAVSDFTAKENGIRKQRALKSSEAKKAVETARNRHAAKTATALDHAANYAQERRVQLESHFANREARIAQASANAEHAFTLSIEEAKGQQIGHSQTTTLDARKAHSEKIDALKAEANQFANELAEDRQTFVRLRAQTSSAFRGFPLLAKRFASKNDTEERADDTGDVIAVQQRLRNKLQSGGRALAAFRKQPLPSLFRYLPLHWVVPLVFSGIAVAGLAASWGSHQFLIAGGIVAVASALLWMAQRVASGSAKKAAAEIERSFRGSVDDYNYCRENSDAHFDAKRKQLDAELEEADAGLKAAWSAAEEEAAAKLAVGQEKIAAKKERLLATNAERRLVAMAALAPGETGGTGQIQAAADAESARIENDFESQMAGIESEFESGMTRLALDWADAIAPHVAVLESARSAAVSSFPEWSPDFVGEWNAPDSFLHAAPIGSIEVDLPQFAGESPQDARLVLPGENGIFTSPLTLRFPDQGCLLLETAGAGEKESVDALNAIILRLLSVAPPGKLSFSIIDPVSLGQNFAGITHLADYEDSIISGRIWTSREQIEKRLAELNEHMEKVIQMYLRNEYESIYDYNEQAGNIAEKYHFLVLADFPAEFSELACKRLLSIVKSGARCGIYTLIHHDTRREIPDGITADDLREHAIRIHPKRDGSLQIDPLIGEGLTVALDRAPAAELATELIRKVGEASSDSNRIEVPFAHIAPADEALWKNDTTEELRIPIGRTGATKLQFLALGKGTRQHALFAGKTGSGKSTLFHVIITNLALSCSPDQVEFYLVDFKKGVEFKCYATHRLPHARVIAIESDREFGLSVLQRLDEELKRRGELFRELGVQDIAGYKKAGGGEMPRTLLMIDEFQEFFVEEDRIAQGASVLLDRIVRQGRAFGIHVLLGSQTLGGAYSLARATLGQMVVRVALQCNEADAYLIMDDSNPAPRLLTRPGEGIYNDSAGAVEANSPFQTVWLSEEERDEKLVAIQHLTESAEKTYDAPVVFEGNAPANVIENAELVRLINNPPPSIPKSARLPLGAPNAIKGPTTAEFRNQSGNHMLIVGQREDAVLAMYGVGLVALSAQFPAGSAQFYLIDGSPPDSAERSFFSDIAGKLRHPLVTSYETDLGEIMTALALEQKRRSDEGGEPAPPIFLFINGLQRFKKLRYDDDLAFSFDASSDGDNPSMQLNELICEGAPLGIHLIASIDSFNNVGRTLSRKALAEFEMRLLFQMSANDSASLIDTPKASSLGMHRALFYNEHEGYLETFRPYAMPPHGWGNLT